MYVMIKLYAARLVHLTLAVTLRCPPTAPVS
jgi:hypothetical protein